MALRGYNRDEYEDLDEYEDDGEEQQEQEAGEEEYDEEEAPQPTQEELEYLELRQRLKEAYRKQMKKEPGSARSNSTQRGSKLPFDNYGSFFGPSQPVIAQRVIQESKSLLENPHLAARVSNAHHGNNNKRSAMTPAGSKAQVGSRLSKVTNGLKTKVQMIKNTRDYSFLLSDDTEVPVPTKDLQPRNVSVRNSEARPAQVPSKSKQSLCNSSARVASGHEERKPVPTGGKMQPKMVTHKSPSGSKPTSASMDSRKQMGSGHGSGPGRPVVPKGLPSKTPVATTEKKVSAPVVKNSLSNVHKSTPTRLQPSIAKKSLQQKKEHKDLSNGKLVPKPSVPSSKPQVKQSTAKVSAHAAVKDNHPKKRPTRQYSDFDEDDAGAISMIRQMFGYNPNRYRDADDDSDMEANFDEILMEEKRSAKIARKEDEEELHKIEEEERRERMRKEAKRRKLAQR